LDPREELLLAVWGSFAVLKFDDLGGIERVVRIVAGGRRREAAIGVEVKPDDWHTVVALEPDSILLEVKAGPYVASVGKEFASWSPEEGHPAAATYLSGLRRLVQSILGAMP
jgi:cupin fold WbuC family metalloprotein